MCDISRNIGVQMIGTMAKEWRSDGVCQQIVDNVWITLGERSKVVINRS